MGFEGQQVRKLRAKLKPRHVRSRLVEGTELHYLEGWHVIAEANRTFGFDGWDRETVDSKCVWTKQNGSRFSAAYITRVRVTVKAGDTSIVREGSGAGEAHEATPGLAHDRAAKAAETDATKRSLMTFGNDFGLSLYASPTDTAAVKSTDRLQSGRVIQNQRKDHLQADAAISLEVVTEHTQPAGAPPAEPEATAGATGKLPSWPTFDPFEEAARRTEARGRIDKSQLALSEPRRERDPEHLKRVATRPCLICGRNRTQAHHLTYLQPRAMGRKVSDEFTVPLCSTHHRELHASGNERSWWAEQGIDPEPLAKVLWGETLRSPRPTTGETSVTKVAQPQARS